MSFFQRLRNALSRFMYGRNGADQLGVCMIWGAILLDLAGMLIKKSGIVSGIIGFAATALAIWALWRVFSRNLEKRRAENAAFLQKIWWPVKRRFASGRQQRMDREHRYFTCPKCKTVCRVPAGKGKNRDHLSQVPR